MPDFSLNPEIPLSYKFGPSPVEQLSQVMSLGDMLQRQKLNQMQIQQAGMQMRGHQAQQKFFAPGGEGYGLMNPQTQAAPVPQQPMAPVVPEKPYGPDVFGPATEASVGATHGANPADYGLRVDMPAGGAMYGQPAGTGSTAQAPTVPAEPTPVVQAPPAAMAKPQKSSQTSSELNPISYDFAGEMNRIEKTYAAMMSNPELAYVAEDWKNKQIDVLDKKSQIAQRYNQSLWYNRRGTGGTGSTSKADDVQMKNTGAMFERMSLSTDPEEQQANYTAAYSNLYNLGRDVSSLPHPSEVNWADPAAVQALGFKVSPYIALAQGTKGIEEQQKLQVSKTPDASFNYKLPENEQKEWTNDLYKSNPKTMSGRSAIGAVEKHQVPLENAKMILMDPKHVITKAEVQNLANIMSDVETGHSESDLAFQNGNYIPLLGELKNLWQRASGQPVGAISGAMKQQMLDRVNQLLDLHSGYTKSTWGAFKASHSGRMAAQLPSFLESANDQGNGVKKPSEIFEKAEWDALTNEREKMGAPTIGFDDPIAGQYNQMAQMKAGTWKPAPEQPQTPPEKKPSQQVIKPRPPKNTGMTDKDQALIDKYTKKKSM